jgi:primary-amine oxidase
VQTPDEPRGKRSPLRGCFTRHSRPCESVTTIEHSEGDAMIKRAAIPIVTMTMMLVAGTGVLGAAHQQAAPAARTSKPASAAAAPAAAARAVADAQHPLDPLSASEIATAVRLVRAQPELSGTTGGGAQGELLFPTVTLNEPSKAEVRAFTPGSTFRREALVAVFDRTGNRTFEAIVDLRARRVISFMPLANVQPSIMNVEIDRVVPLVRADPAFQEAMRKRGLTNMAEIQLDPWAPGLLDPKSEPKTTRWVRALAYVKGTQKNPYARPIEGVVALVNLNAMRVERVIDTGFYPIPPETADLDEPSIAKRGKLRAPTKPLQITQPLGPSFTVAGHEVRWQNWRFRFSLEPREGLVLHTVGYEDGGRVRPILYRASLSEMLVPYADPSSNWSFRNAFDEGEYGLGRLTDSLEIGIDAPKHARFFDAVFADDLGKPTVVPRAVAIYERDGGLLWKHFEYYSNNRTDGRRARELVIFSMVTVANYDYGFNWIFRQDGTMELQAVLTGIMLTKGVQSTKIEASTAVSGTDGSMSGMSNTAQHAEGRFSHLIAPNLAAVHHQHFFNFRLDFDIDGGPNSIREINTRALLPGADNPSLNAFVMEETPLRSEADAQRDMNLASARRWAVINPTSHNALGQPAGYLIAPGDNSVPYLQPDSPIRQRAGFINHHFWATAFDPAERHAAGEYPNQSDPAQAQGLPAWTKANRSLEGQDVVAWYTFGVTHIPRPEEWPVMSATTAGFKLVPVSFFTRNPALDVPRPR